MFDRQILVSRPDMKAPCMSKEQYKGIRDIVNDQGFAMHCRAISNGWPFGSLVTKEEMLVAF